MNSPFTPNLTGISKRTSHRALIEGADQSKFSTAPTGFNLNFTDIMSGMKSINGAGFLKELRLYSFPCWFALTI